MSKRNILGLMVLAVTLAAMPMTVFAQDMRIGVANLAKLREQAPQAEEAIRTLEREFAERQRGLLAEQRAVQQLQERLQREAEVLTNPDEAARLERDLRNRQRELQRNVTQYEEDLNMRRNEELGRLQRLIFTEIQAYASEQNFDIVLVEGVIHASNRVDITDQVLARLRALNSGGRR